jgi:hypothetical protein
MLVLLVGVSWTVLRSSDRSPEEAPKSSESPPGTVRIGVDRDPSSGRAPPGRGRILEAEGPARPAGLEEGEGLPHAEGMNGEVVAWVVDSSGQPVDQWLLLSDDCGVRAGIHQGTALTLSPPGECRFRVAPDEETEVLDSDWTWLEVIPGDTVYLELTAADPEARAEDSRAEGPR